MSRVPAGGARSALRAASGGVRRPGSTASFLAACLLAALALTSSAQAAFPGQNGRIAFAER